MLESDKKAMLIRVGKALYGERWQTDLARDLEFPDSRRIRQWLSGDRPIPKGLLIGLSRLLAQRKSTIEKAMDEINGNITNELRNHQQ